MSILFLHHPKETDLALFAGGELGPLARWRIERHIQICPECEEAVADFFHLQSDISELAGVPPVDWNALGLSVREALAQGGIDSARTDPAASDPEMTSGGSWHRPFVWQAGLASAAVFCAVVVLWQYSAELEQTAAPRQTAARSMAVEQRESAPAGLRARSTPAEDSLAAANRDSRQPLENSFRRKDGDSPADPVRPLAGAQSSAFAVGDSATQGLTTGTAFRDSASPSRRQRDIAEGGKPTERRVDGREATRSTKATLPADVEADSTLDRPVASNSAARSGAGQQAGQTGTAEESAAQKAEEPQRVAFARGDKPAAPAPDPPAVPDRRQAASESFGARGEEQARAGSEMKAVPGEEAFSDRAASRDPISSLGATVHGGELREAILPAGSGFSPPPGAAGATRLDSVVAAGGGISYRSVDTRTGTITIYDVYVP